MVAGLGVPIFRVFTVLLYKGENLRPDHLCFKRK